MFAASALIAVIVFAIVSLVLPFRFKTLTSKWIEQARSALLSRCQYAVFCSGEGKAGERLVKLRTWGITAFALLVIFLVSIDKPFQDHPSNASRVGFAILGAVALTAAVAFAYEMGRAFLPWVHGAGLLSRFGFRALWVLQPGQPSAALRDGLAARVRGSSRVLILDVTGQDLIGKGAGPSGGMLYDTLTSMTSVPVNLLLLQPESYSPDPEQRRATVFQSVLAEMDITPQNFMRRIRATLDAVQTLNESRPEDARIDVRFYSEKPSFRSIVFDESVLVAPWVPRESTFPTPFLEVAQSAADPTLYSAFRFHFARLWVASAPKQEVAAKSHGFKSVVVRRAPAAVAE